MTSLDRPPTRRRPPARSWEREVLLIASVLTLFLAVAVWVSLGR